MLGQSDRLGRVPLSARDLPTTLVAVSDGYASSAFPVPTNLGGDIVLKLVPGGSLFLRVLNWEQLDSPRVYARSDAELIRLPVPSRTGELRIDGLPAGELRVEVVRGNWWYRGKCYGFGVVNVPRAGEASLTIAAVQTSRPPRTTVSGTVHIPRAWELGRSTRRLSVAVRETNMQHRLRWVGQQAGNAMTIGATRLAISSEIRTAGYERLVPIGRYVVGIDHLTWCADVVLTNDTRGDFTLPEPSWVRLRVLDDETQLPIKADVEGYVHPEFRAVFLHDPHSNGYRLAATEGSMLRIRVEAPGYVGLETVVPVDCHDVEFTARLRRAGRLIVRLFEDGQLLRITGVLATAESLSNRHMTWVEVANGEAVFDTLTPDRYHVQVKHVTGFRPVGVQVDVPSGEQEAVTLCLVRERAR